MKKILAPIILVWLLWSCSKKEEATPALSNTSTGYVALLSIARHYSSVEPGEFTDTILPTSYWSRNGIKKPIPLLPVIYNGPSGQTPNYQEYRDTLPVVIGDVIELHIDVAHKTENGISGGGIFCVFCQSPGSYEGQFLCAHDQTSQTVTMVIN